VREEYALPLISIRHEGVEEIIREWRQMVENFDNRFDHRIVVPVGRARATGKRVTLRWIGAYVIDDAPALLGEGTEIAHYEGDRIKHLETTWTQETIARNVKWATEHGSKLPGLLEYAATLAPKGA